MNDYAIPQAAAHRLELDGRESLTVSGVVLIEKKDSKRKLFCKGWKEGGIYYDFRHELHGFHGSVKGETV